MQRFGIFSALVRIIKEIVSSPTLNSYHLRRNCDEMYLKTVCAKQIPIKWISTQHSKKRLHRTRLLTSEQSDSDKGKVMKLRTPGKFGQTFANSGNPDETAPYEPSHHSLFTDCLVDHLFIPVLII